MKTLKHFGKHVLCIRTSALCARNLVLLSLIKEYFLRADHNHYECCTNGVSVSISQWVNFPLIFNLWTSGWNNKLYLVVSTSENRMLA